MMNETSSFSSRCLSSNKDVYRYTNNITQGKVFECLNSNIDEMIQKITGEREFQDTLGSAALGKQGVFPSVSLSNSAGIQ